MRPRITLIIFGILVLFMLPAGVLSADRLVIKDSGGEETFKVDETGKIFTESSVGIGTETPARALHLTGENALARIDRSLDSCGFMLTRVDDSGDVLKSFFFAHV